MKVFCFVCKQHVDLGECDTNELRSEAMKRFKACGHDDRKVPQLRRGPIGAYARDLVAPAEPQQVEPAVVECFENREPRVDPERLAA